MSSTHPSVLVIWLGIGISMVGWIWFRHPGQPFWSGGPLWKASEYLKPTGVKLWIAGSIVSMSAGLWFVWSLLAG